MEVSNDSLLFKNEMKSTRYKSFQLKILQLMQ